MTRRGFDKFMVESQIGTNRKLRRLPVVQRWVYVAGVLALAAQSPMRGSLLITDGEPVTDEDVAEEATVSVKDARAALASFRRLGMLERDQDGVEWVHDWDKINPDPRPSDSPEETRKRKRAQRLRERESRGHSNVTHLSRVTPPDSHDPEVEGEVEEVPPNPRDRGKVMFDRKQVPKARLELAHLLLDAFNDKAGTAYKPFDGRDRPTEDFKRIIGALTSHEATYEQGVAAINVAFADPYWTGKPGTGVVFGPNVWAKHLENAASSDGQASSEKFLAHFGAGA